MKFFQKLFHPIIKNSAKKLEALIYQFLKLDKLLSKEIDKEFKTFYEIENMRFKERELKMI